MSGAREQDFFEQRLPFVPGPTNAIDYWIDKGLDAIDISWLLAVPTWNVRERFAEKAAQRASNFLDGAR